MHFQAIAAENLHTNFLISPFSVWILMVLIAEAAANGQSLAQLRTVLRLPNDLSLLRAPYKSFQHLLYVNITSIELNINQAIISDTNRPLHQIYIDLLESSYDVDHLSVDFHALNAATVINDYLNDETRQHGRKLIKFEDLDEAQVLLVSSIFFRGQWKVYCGLKRQFKSFQLIVNFSPFFSIEILVSICCERHQTTAILP